ncbi:hypothetical protein PHYSODRAFT_489807 [Phytophthora sojae]|uniref:DDE Tnp4 domain-containing protein n=1 Tax=Phytophthora sojae (strain P6497) TaxID=1094619 RepID=G4Z2I4_PHYSP|nr:hypothetical protein PHYSODRAFT_489807 [Phytophthora sojae]EGZ20025.1 hypothetical protein PHYSODRAFT_489807 [Phytophthora sojae]|eukprot:XP_009522742.1 hypothetical protein PHYSODRAFT_489807 [Phytophthora sojae]
MRSRHYLTAQCLEAPCNSAWMLLYRFGSDVNFINATSLTRPAFEQLLRRFSRFYFIPKAKLRGRPPKLRYHHQVLGLVLSFYVGSMEQSSLSMLFGLPPSTLSCILCRAEEALSTALHGYAPARISWPSPTRQAELPKLVEAREPLLKYTFGFIGGKNFKVRMQLYSFDPIRLNPYCWLYAAGAATFQRRSSKCYVQWMAIFCFVTGTICFAADDCIIWSRHNCPGS